MGVLDKVQEIMAVKEALDTVAQEISPEWIMRAVASSVAKYFLEEAKRLGPPPGYAESLKMTEPEARTFYNFTLDCAIMRKDMRSEHGGE